MKNARWPGILAVLFAVCIWGGWIPVTRLGVVGRLQPSDVAAVRYGAAGLVLLPYFLRHWRQVPWHRPGWLLMAAGGAGVPYFATFALGLTLANTGQAAVFGPGASSLFTILLAWLWLHEPIGARRWAGIALSLTGFALVVLHDLSHGGGRLSGFALILLAALAWSLFTIASRRLAMSPQLIAAFVGFANAALYLPFYLHAGGLERLMNVPADALLLQAVYQGVLTGTVAMVAFAFAVGRLGAGAAAAFTPLAPVIAAVVGWWLVGDTVDLATACGLTLVVAGVVIGSVSASRLSARAVRG